ncbi:FixH family protein [Erythrobacter sp. THAF29]|uniref:FixH family protein n=1 Tax=Erythrobacter sp. THAF29 TaxID=2587851 RepID=UPI0012689861|nr:FixH family protein [Erythrobacter sp. THAF29]QFT76471.1 FixH [Erythrobacter sp. THAF29]
MTDNASHPKFTGKHMAAVLVIGFGIVVAVNFFMASLATSGFHGVVVENSYVASQKFNGWLDEAEKSRALGWKVETVRDESGFVVVEAANLPGEARVEAELRRPIGEREYASLAFTSSGDGRYRSTEPVTPGRWIIRLRIEAGGDVWTGESELR